MKTSWEIVRSNRLEKSHEEIKTLIIHLVKLFSTRTW